VVAFQFIHESLDKHGNAGLARLIPAYGPDGLSKQFYQFALRQAAFGLNGGELGWRHSVTGLKFGFGENPGQSSSRVLPPEYQVRRHLRGEYNHPSL